MTPSVPDKSAAEVEHQNHRYVGNDVPWYVHALWVLFWIFTIAYVLIYLVPALRTELLAPP
jgi:hypothetical protein